MSHGFYSQTPLQQQYPPQQYAQPPQTPYPTLDRTHSYSAPGHSPQAATSIGYSPNHNRSASDLMASQQQYPPGPYPPQSYAPYGQPPAQAQFSPFSQPSPAGFQPSAVAAPPNASRFQHQHSQSVPGTHPQASAFAPGQSPGAYGAQPGVGQVSNGVGGYPPAAQYGAAPASQQPAPFRTTQSAAPPRNSVFVPPVFGSRARSAEPVHAHADLMRAPTIASARSLDSALVNNRPLPYPSAGTTASLPSVRERASTIEGSPGSKQFTYPGFESPTKTGYIPYNRPTSTISPSGSPPKPTYAAQASANPRTAPFDPFSASRISQMASSPPKPGPAFGTQPAVPSVAAPIPPFAPTWPQEKAMKPDISLSTSSSTSKFTAGLGSGSSSPTRRPNPPFAPSYKRESSPTLPAYSSSKMVSPPTAKASPTNGNDWEERAQEWRRESSRAEDAIARAHEAGRSFLQERGMTQPKSEAAAIAEEYLARKGISPTRSNPSPERSSQTVKDYASTPPTRRFQSPEKGESSWRTSTLGRKDRWAEQKGDYMDQKWTQAARRRESPERGQSPERQQSPERYGGYSSPERRSSPANGSDLPPKPRSQRTFPSDGDYVQHRPKESPRTNGTSRHRHQFSEPTRSPRNEYYEPPEDDYDDPPPPPEVRRRSQEVGRRSYDEGRRSHDEGRRSHDTDRRGPDEDPYEYHDFEQASPSRRNYDTWNGSSRREQQRDPRPIPQEHHRSPPHSRQSSPERPPVRQQPPPHQRPPPQPPQPQSRPSPKPQPPRSQPVSPVTSPRGPNGRPPQQSSTPQRQSMAMRMAAQALADEGGRTPPSNTSQPRAPVRPETRQDVYDRSPAPTGRRELPPRTPSPPPSETEEEYEEPAPHWRQPPPPPSPRREPVNSSPRKGLSRVPPPPPPPPQPRTPVIEQEDEYEYEYDEPQWEQPVHKSRLADVPKREPLRENIQPALTRPRPPARRDASPAHREPTPLQREPTPVQREPTPVHREPTPVRREPTPVRREASRDAALRRPVPPPPAPPAPMSPPQPVQQVQQASLARQPPPPPQIQQYPPPQVQQRPPQVQEHPRKIQERPQVQERPPPIRSPSPARAPAIMHRDDDPAPAPGLPSFSFDLADEPPKPAGPAISVTSPREPDSAGPRIQVNGAEPSSVSIIEDSRPQLMDDRSDSPVRSGGGLRCAGCSGAIAGRIVSAMGSRWHPHCFKCDDCGTLLEHVSSYEHDGRAYCHLDYHDRFAPRCYHCKTPIVDERFIALDDPALGGQRYYHELHFFCAECGDPFLDPSASSAAPPAARGQIFGEGDRDDDVGFTVFNGHAYCESCHVRLRMPRCGSSSKSGRPGPPGVGCGKPIREEAVEALGRKWHWKCFTCDSCKKPFEDPSFFQREDSAFCDPCYRILLKNEF